MVNCPICGSSVKETDINRHLDSDCSDFIEDPKVKRADEITSKASNQVNFFQTPGKRGQNAPPSSTAPPPRTGTTGPAQTISALSQGTKRPLTEINPSDIQDGEPRSAKKAKVSNFELAAPLAERMRPKTLDEVHGQDLVGPDGVIRSLIESGKVPSMILWGGPGTGKTTIARLIAQNAGTRFVEINSTTSGVGEVKKLFTEAKNELSLTGRKTIVFCDEIHRFNKAQQDTFLGPVEAGIITLIGATTENPSFKVINALLSRCRIFTLAKLTDDDVFLILKRALHVEPPLTPDGVALLTDNDHALLRYLSSFADGDARTALNLLSLAIDLSSRPGITEQILKQSLTKTFVYDTKSDFHYDTISAFHKSIRGSDADAALYYLARMLRSGEDPLYVSRRMVVIASEDVGLADNTLLPLAIAAHTAAEKIGMPECAINLAHCCVALAKAPKSTRSYKGYKAASKALDEPGTAGLPIPLHLRNAPTKLMRDMGYGKEYKYNPSYRHGEVLQDYLPERLEGRRFLGELDMGEEVDEELAAWREQQSKDQSSKNVAVNLASPPRSSPPRSPDVAAEGHAVLEPPRRGIAQPPSSLSPLAPHGLAPSNSSSARLEPSTSVRSLLKDPLVLARDRALLSSSPPRSSAALKARPDLPPVVEEVGVVGSSPGEEVDHVRSGEGQAEQELGPHGELQGAEARGREEGLETGQAEGELPSDRAQDDSGAEEEEGGLPGEGHGRVVGDVDGVEDDGLGDGPSCDECEEFRGGMGGREVGEENGEDVLLDPDGG